MAATRSLYRPIRLFFMVYFFAVFSFSVFAHQSESSNLLPEISTPPVITIVLDLDETLIYGRKLSLIYIRPGVIEWLRKWRTIPGVELVVWTAGKRSYADTIVEVLDTQTLPQPSPLTEKRPQPAFAHVITRNDGTWFHGVKSPKDLSLIGRQMERVVLIDNQASNCRMNTANSLVVVDFEGENIPDYTFIHLDTVLTCVVEQLRVFKQYHAVPPGYLRQLLGSLAHTDAQLVNIVSYDAEYLGGSKRFFGVNALPVEENNEEGDLIARITQMRNDHIHLSAMEGRTPPAMEDSRAARATTVAPKRQIIASLLANFFSYLPILFSLAQEIALPHAHSRGAYTRCVRTPS